MKREKIIALFIISSCCLGVSAQEKWDLHRCIEYALEHNLSIKQQEAERDKSSVELNTAKMKRLPNLSGSVGQSFNFGRALQENNTYSDRNTNNTSFSVSTNIPLFTGLNITNNIALGKLNVKAATEDLNKAMEDISIQVTSFYLQVLFNEELAKVAVGQVELSREQLKLKQAFYDNGKASESELYEARSRLAQDEMSSVQAGNDYKLALLDLTQMLELPTPEGFSIVSPDGEEKFSNISLPEDIYREAVLGKPGIKAAELRTEGAERSIRIAQSAWYPQLSFNAGLGTSYYKMLGQDNIMFGTQLNKNLSEYLSFSLSIPIFDRLETRNRVRTARIQRTALSWKLEESKKALFKEIQQAYYNAVASESKYRSSNTANEAAEVYFRLVSEKYANGKAASTEYNEARTSWMKAVSSMIQAKYDYMFRTKILDFYKGVPLTME